MKVRLRKISQFLLAFFFMLGLASLITSVAMAQEGCEVRKNGNIMCRNAMVVGFDYYNGSSAEPAVTVYFKKNNYRFSGFLSSLSGQGHGPGILLSGLTWAYESKLPVDVVFESSGSEHTTTLANYILGAKVKFINEESSYNNLPPVVLERESGDSK